MGIHAGRSFVRSSVISSVRSFVRQTVYKKQIKNPRMGNHCGDRGDNLLRTRPRGASLVIVSANDTCSYCIYLKKFTV